MNKKEQRELQKEWLLVALAAMLGFLINIAASATYDLYTSEFGWRKLALLVPTAVLSIFIVGFFMYIFENMDELKNDKNSFSDILWTYIKSIFRKKAKNEESTNIQEHIKTFHELMIVILRRRALFRLFENSLKQKGTDAEVKNNAFSSYYIMDYVRGQLIDLRKFFETDSSSYKISDLVAYTDLRELKKAHKTLFKKWKNQFEAQVNKIIAHIDRDSGNLTKQVDKQSIDGFIDETNIFMNEIIKGLRRKGTLILDDSLRDPSGDFLNIEQEADFREFQKWLCSPKE